MWDYPNRRQRPRDKNEVAAIHQAPQLHVDLQNYIRMSDAFGRYARNLSARECICHIVSMIDIIQLLAADIKKNYLSFLKFKSYDIPYDNCLD